MTPRSSPTGRSARSARSSTTRLTSLNQSRSRFTAVIDIRRRSTFYIWRVLLPLILLVAASWGVYWVDPTQLQPQISTVVSILLSIVVFNITIDFALPKVAYLTFIDTHAMISYLFMLASIVTVFRIHHRLNTRGLDAARATQRRAQWAFPSAYAAVFLAEVLRFLILAGADAKRPASITPVPASATAAPSDTPTSPAPLT